jgi:hypothetical protein
VRLLGAELRGLARPLTAWVAVALVVLACLAASAGARAALGVAATGSVPAGRGDLEGMVQPPDECAEYGLPEGDACQRAIAAARAAMRDGRPEAEAARALAARLHDPVAAGWLAAGQLGSLPGAAALLVLAASSVGGELRRRTLGPLVARAGRRLPILAAKAVSLWLAGAGLLVASWAALALLTVGLRLAAEGAPPPLPAGDALALAGGRVARALLVMAGFAVVWVLAGVVARSGPGTIALGAAGLGAALLGLAAGPRFAGLNPAGWIAAAMGVGARVTVIDHVWVAVPPGDRPGTVAGLLGLAGLGAAAWCLAAHRFRRAPIRA